MRTWHALWAITSKDICVWLRQPVTIAATLLPAIGFIIVVFFYTAAVGRNPVALVIRGTGPHTRQLVNILEHSEAFIAHRATPTEAEAALHHLDVAAVITIPASFDAAYDAHQPDPVTIQINNLNLDFTNDLRRSLPSAITAFYQQQNPTPIQITPVETDLHAQDISLAQFQMAPTLVLLLIVAGLINSGVATAREWEDQTIKELLLAPIGHTPIVVGKLLAGWITTLLISSVVILIGAASGYLQPQGFFWLPTLLVIALIALASVGFGVALGTLLRRFLPVAALSINMALYLFFLSGGIGVAAFFPAWIQVVAHGLPTFYGIHALQMLIFYASLNQFGRDIMVLAGSALGALLLGTFALRRNAVT
jgi:ABC-2 type transport system permease protein